MRYLVIIGDIVKSREITNRIVFQKKFSATLKQVQDKYKNTILSPLTLTLGDEFQVVLHEAENLFDLTGEIEFLLHGVRLRFGLGLGEINTDINSENAIGMDGPAFHYARTAIENARKQEYTCSFLSGENKSSLNIGLLLDWINVSISKWNDQRKQILYYHRQNWNQKQIALELKLSQSAVSQNINDPYFRLVLFSQKKIQAEINDYLRPGNDD